MKRKVNRRKSLVALILSLAMLLSSVNIAFATSFEDDPVVEPEERKYVDPEKESEYIKEITKFTQGTTTVGTMTMKDDSGNEHSVIVRGLSDSNKEKAMYDYYHQLSGYHVHSEAEANGIMIVDTFDSPFDSVFNNNDLIDAEKYSNLADNTFGYEEYGHLSKEYKEAINDPFEYEEEPIYEYPKDQEDNPFDKDSNLIEESGPFDSLLCWAATGANMLWSSGYAQDTVIPGKNKSFENEDEVFEYLRMKSKKYYSEEIKNANPDDTGDHSGSIDTAINWFIDDAYQGSLAEKEKIKKNIKIIDKEQLKKDPGEIKLLESINDYSFGLSLGWVHEINDGKYFMAKTGHAVTVNGLITNPKAKELEDKYIGIIIADSDNTVAASAARNWYEFQLMADSDSERREKATEQPNIYTTYELELRDYGNLGKLWTLVGYVIEDAFQAVIRGITALKDSNKIGAEKPNPPSDTGSGTNSQGGGTGNGTNDQGGGTGSGTNDQGGGTGSGTNDQGGGTGSGTNDQGGGTGSGSNGQDGGTILPPSPSKEPIVIEESTWTEEENTTNYNQPETAHVIQDGIDYTAIKEFMTREDWLLYSPKNWKYSSSKDTTFRVYVRTSITSLSEIQLDNALLGEEDFETTECMDGLFLLVLNEQKMKSLSEGEHDLRILLNGYEQQTRTITVK